MEKEGLNLGDRDKIFQFFFLCVFKILILTSHLNDAVLDITLFLSGPLGSVITRFYSISTRFFKQNENELP